MKTNSKIADAAAALYEWIDSQDIGREDQCGACGECCDFDGFDHKLFVTSPELIYFSVKMGPEKIRPMTAGRCPYNIDGRCEVYTHRFGGCRIFFCRGDSDLQNKISEAAITKFKAICAEFDLPYRYTELRDGLNRLAGKPLDSTNV